MREERRECVCNSLSMSASAISDSHSACLGDFIVLDILRPIPVLLICRPAFSAILASNPAVFECEESRIDSGDNVFLA